MLRFKTQPICIFGVPSDANGGDLDDSPQVWRAQTAFPSVSGQEEPLVESILHELESRGWAPSDLFQVQLALEEGVANAIEHGNKHDPDKLVRIEVELDDARILVKIQDEGEGFPHWAIPDPTDESNLDKPCGRGVYLIRNLMTKVWFNENGSCIYMEKNPSPLDAWASLDAQDSDALTENDDAEAEASSDE